MTYKKNDYISLVTITLVYIAIILKYQSTSMYLLVATIGYALIYFVWGILHQLRSGSFHFRVVLEYLLVALLGVIIISTLLI